MKKFRLLDAKELAEECNPLVWYFSWRPKFCQLLTIAKVVFTCKVDSSNRLPLFCCHSFCCIKGSQFFDNSFYFQWFWENKWRLIVSLWTAKFNFITQVLWKECFDVIIELVDVMLSTDYVPYIWQAYDLIFSRYGLNDQNIVYKYRSLVC